jgi:hypothetical protein
MIKLQIIAILLLLLTPSVFAQQIIDLDKLFDKKWKVSESLILRPDKPNHESIVVYSRGRLDDHSLDKIEIFFKKDGVQKGVDVDGNEYSQTWKYEGSNSIWFEDDRRPSKITKLTNTELVFQIPQIYKDSSTGEEELLIAQDTYVTDDTALPVVLSSFVAKKLDDGNVLLIWESALEINSEHFDVEHSLDAKHFNSIGKVVSRNGGSVDQTYFFTHAKPTPSVTNYYRLKLIDKDGSHSYSKIQSVNGTQKSLSKFFPNPTTDEVFIDGEDLSDVVSIKVINLDGREMFKSNAVPEKKVSLKNMAAGVYIVVIEHKSGQITAAKVVKK